MQWVRAANAAADEYGLEGLAALSSRVTMVGFMVLMWPFLLVGFLLALPLNVAKGCLPCLFLLPMLALNLVHLLFLGPLLGTSYLWDKAPFLRPILMIVSIPIAVLDAAYLLTMIGILENPAQIIETPLSWPATVKAFRRPAPVPQEPDTWPEGDFS